MQQTESFNRLKDARYGKMLYNVHDAYVGRSIEMYGEYSQLETTVFEQLARPGSVVIDVGANIGVHTLFFAKSVGPTGIVLAFEPQRIVFQTLCANMALNSITNAHCYRVGLADQAGSLRTPPVNYAADNNFAGLPLGDFEGGEVVEVNRLDHFSLPACQLIKIDAVGMELQVLQGASGLIDKFKPVLYVANERPQNSDALVRHIDSLGYKMYAHRPALYNPDNFLRNPTNVFGNVISMNLLCFHSSTPHNIQGLPAVEPPQE